MARTTPSRSARTSARRPETAPAGGEPRWLPAAAVALVFLVKLIVVWQLHDHPMLQEDAGLDTTAYVTLARRVLGGDLGLGPGLYYVSPLYIYFLAAVLAVGSLTAVRVLQVALGTVAVALIFKTTEVWFNRRAAWMAGALAAFTGVLTFYEALVMQSGIDAVLTAGLLGGVAFAIMREEPRWAALAGVCLGLETLNRPNVLIAGAAVLVGLAIVRRQRPAAFMAAGLVLALLPVGLRNVVVAREWTFTSSQGGLNFYIGNNAQATGTYRAVPEVTANIAGQADEARRVAERAEGRSLSDSQVSSYFFGLGLEWIRAHPGAAVRLTAKKIAAAFNGQFIYLNASLPFYKWDARTLLRLLVVGPWLIVPLGLVGLVVAAPSSHRAAYVVWAAFVPVYALAVAVFFVADRYRLPMLVPLCIGAGAAIDLFIRAYREDRVRAIAPAFVAVAVLAVGANWPMHLDDGRAEERVRMAERMISLGRLGEADVWATRAEEIYWKPSLLHYRLGQGLMAFGHPSEAVARFSKAHDLDPDDPTVKLALGRALTAAGRPSEAVPLLRAAIAAGKSLDDYGYDLANALAASGDSAGARDVLGRVALRSTDAGVWLRTGRLAAEVGAPDLAERFFSRAVNLQPADALARQLHGASLLSLGRLEDARAELAESVRLDPRDAASFSTLAYVELQLGRVDEARAHLAEALRLDPKDELATKLKAVIR
jgi:Flp pilus assembly protein TadD